jgi:hypothetical protein
MPIYNCVLCKFNSELKTNYTRHLKSKKHLNNVNNDDSNVIKSINIIKNPHFPSNLPHFPSNIPQNLTQIPHFPSNLPHFPSNIPHLSQDVKYNCKYCSKKYTRYDNLKRHESTKCKKYQKEKEQIEELKAIIVDKKNNEEELKAIILDNKNNEEKYKRDIEHLYKQIEILMEAKAQPTTIINIDKQINLNSYGKEDLSHITAGFKDNLLKIPFVSIPKMIEEVHFSDKNPENKNIMLPNKKENYVKVYEDNKWVFKDKKSTISKLLDDNYNIIDDHYEETKDNEDNPMPPHVDKQYINFRDLYNDGDTDLQNEIRVDCELVLLNNRK